MPISETISNSYITMAAASLPTIELNFFNNVIFSVINKIRHILKQRAAINQVLTETIKAMNLTLIRLGLLGGHSTKSFAPGNCKMKPLVIYLKLYSITALGHIASEYENKMNQS